jgi:plastocyanin
MGWLNATSAGALCALAVSTVACGEGDAPATVVRVDAAPDGSLAFERPAARATAGPVSIEMRNPSDIPHAVAIRGGGADATGETVGRDGTSRVQADLRPGTYTLFCPVGGHEQAGMVATLTVR